MLKYIANSDPTRLMLVAVSFFAMLFLMYQYFQIDTDKFLTTSIFLMAFVWFFLAALYISARFKHPLYGTFASILATLAVIMIIFAYADLYRLFGITNGALHVDTNDRLECLYFSIVTFTTLGYGDFFPNESTRLIAASEALSGFLSLAVLIGVFSRAWSRFNENNPNQDTN